MGLNTQFCTTRSKKNVWLVSRHIALFRDGLEKEGEFEMKNWVKNKIGAKYYQILQNGYAPIRGFICLVRRHCFEKVGSYRYSKVALGELDDKLAPYLNFRNGFFIEAGANDGLSYSNTYYLEKALGWQGVLVEPVPRLFKKCQRNRPKNSIYNYALVSPENEGSSISICETGDRGLLSKVAEGGSYSAGKTMEICGKTLTSILAERNVPKIDFLSLDVEGYEIEVLKGLDLQRFKPSYILVETAHVEKVDQCLQTVYDRIAQLTYHDYLYHLKAGH